MNKKIRNCWIGFLVIFLPGISVASDVRQQVSIVFGSYSSRITAESNLRRIAEKLKTPLYIAQVEVKGRTYFRIVDASGVDVGAKRRQLAQVRRRVEPEAWLLITDKSVESGPLLATDNKIRQSLPADQPEPPAKTGSGNIAISQPDLIFDTGDAEDPLIVNKFNDSEIDISIDGRLDEPVWSKISGISNMSVTNPDTLASTRYDTVTKFVYTERGLYVGILNEQPRETLLPRLTRRDDYINRDGNELLLDTSGDALYGLWFNVNLGGSLADGTVLPEKNYSSNWDGPWMGDAEVTDEGYSTEYFLPWSMMAMPDADQERRMAVLVARRVAHLDETWSWPAVPYTAPKYMSAMQQIQLSDVNPRQQWAVYPFTSSTYDHLESDTGYRTGADIFWRPSSNMQLTATLNPDFGTVESDNVVVNLTAFETFFSEKRLFFVEGYDVFVTSPRANPFGGEGFNMGARSIPGNFFPTPTTLLNTRRIGSAALTPDIPPGMTISDVELFQPTELYGAVKATGQTGRFRYGVLSAFEEDTRFHGTDSVGNELRIEQQGRDFGVARLSYEDSTDGMKSIGWMSTAVTHPDRDAFVHGVDAHYISSTSQWRADIQLMYSDIEDTDGFGGLADLSYSPRQGVTHSLSFDYLDEDLDINDLGFFRRNDLIALNYSYRNSRSDFKNLRNWNRSISLSQQYNQDGRSVRSGVFWRNTFIFRNSMLLKTEMNYFPKRWDDRNSEGNGEFKIEDRWFAEAGIGTNSSKSLSASFAAGMNQEELGDWTKQLKGGLTYKPNDRLSLNLDLIYQDRDGWLLHQTDRYFATYESTNLYPSLSLEYFLSARQQMRLTMQWAGIKADEQDFYMVPLGDGDLIDVERLPTDPSVDFGISQLTAQLRYRWEIAPLSDLYVVYTRGSHLVTPGDDDFEDFFRAALTDPLVSVFVVKLRYRFGT